MIPYEELVAALTNWRARQGLPTGAADYLGEPPRAAYAAGYDVAGDMAEVHDISDLDEIEEISEYEVADAEASASGEIGGEPYAASAEGDGAYGDGAYAEAAYAEGDYAESFEGGSFTSDAYGAEGETYGAADQAVEGYADAAEANYIADAPITEEVAEVADPGLVDGSLGGGSYAAADADSLANLGEDDATMIGEAPDGAAPPAADAAFPGESPFDEVEGDAGYADYADDGLPPPPAAGDFEDDAEAATQLAGDPAEPEVYIDAGDPDDLDAGPPPLAPPPDDDGHGTVDIDDGDVVGEATAINDPDEPR